MNQADCKQKDKLIKPIDLIKKMRYSGRMTKVTNIETAKKVVNSYFKIVADSVLDGFSFDLKLSKVSGDEIGSLVIRKRRLEQGEMPKKLYGTDTLSFNPYTIGYKYTIDFDSELMDKRGMVFKPSVVIRKRLCRILNSNKTDYRFLN